MTILRRILGLFVMIAGIIGLLLSLAGLVGLWMIKPAVTASINSTVNILLSSVDTSQKALVITNQALGASVDSVETLSKMLNTTSATIKDTEPVITQVNDIMGETLPSTFEAVSDSLTAAEEAAQSLEGAIKSFDSFRAVLGTIPFLNAAVPASQQSYNPKKPLATSLGELSDSIQEMPSTFKEMSGNLDKADDNLGLLRSNLDVMAQNVSLISTSLSQYQAMIGESQKSMGDLKTLLSNIQNNLGNIINGTVIVLGLFFLWLLAAQVVIFSQGWELYHGTAGRMGTGAPKSEVAEKGTMD